MQKVSKKLIDKFGDDVTLIEYVRGAYNPDTGEYDTIHTDYPTKAHISQFDASLVVAGVVNMEDMRLLCYNFADVIPTKDWKESLQGKMLTIISVMNVETMQNTFLTYILQCRV